MVSRCDKCGATTRWYDEKCPACGAALTVEIPTSPIVLPNFTPAPQRVDQEIAVAPQALATDETPEKTPPQPETVAPPQAPEPQPETPQEPQEKKNDESQVDATRQPPESQPETPQEPQEKKNDESQIVAPPQRFAAFWRAVDVWRSTFDSETASVTIPRGRAARYALGIALELFVCPPCAILAAYFFTRALFADRRAQYHAAMQETEKTRRTLAVGLGVFAAFLCAFIFYVQSQEIALPTETRPPFQFFKK